MLNIHNLHAALEDGTPILKGIDLKVNPGEIHAIMGPNGSGKSTLSKVIAGHPAYQVTQGSIEFNDQDLLSKEVVERANLGVFIGFQYPLEIPGVNNVEFLRMALDSKYAYQGLPRLDDASFTAKLRQQMELLEMDTRYSERGLNEGFSGGEKKRNEILQMAMLEPMLSLLDETDSGLDIDALRIVANGINKLMTPRRSVILVTHYQRLLDYVSPHFVHVLRGGRIVKSGGPELALQLEQQGYDWIP
jgi:Fe-S cluster assembly ATP-binding protein